MSLRDDLTARLQKLQAHRASVVTRHAAELTALDRQIAGASALLAKWDTFTVDEALRAVETAGLRLRIDA